MFSTQVKSLGCEHDKDAFEDYKAQVMNSHEGFTISFCGLFVSVEHLFFGASPDAPLPV